MEDPGRRAHLRPRALEGCVSHLHIGLSISTAALRTIVVISRSQVGCPPRGALFGLGVKNKEEEDEELEEGNIPGLAYFALTPQYPECPLSLPLLLSFLLDPSPASGPSPA